MEDRKLLDAQVFNRTAEIAETIVTNFFILCGFLRVLFHFTLSIILRFKKHRLFNKFLSKKWQSIWQEERVAVYEGWKRMIFCMLYPWYILLNSIIHWIAWTRSKYMKWWSNPFNKGEILASNRLNILPIFLYWVQKSRVEKDNNSQLLLSCHAIQVWIFQ